MAEIDERLKALVAIIKRNQPGNGSYKTKIPGLYFVRQNYPSSPKHFFHNPSICVIAQGKKDMCLNENHYVYSPGDYILSSVSLPLTGEVIEASSDVPYLSIKLDIDLNLLSTLIDELKVDPKSSQSECASIDIGKLDYKLMDAITRLCSLVELDNEDCTYIASLYIREIYYYLLKSNLSALLSQFAEKGSHASKIRELIKEITVKYNEPLRINDLAERIHLSVPTLHRQFKRFTDMSPIQFQKMLRLQHARQMMLSGNYNVNTAAYKVGYESTSQFSREYLRLYGNSPRDDIKRMKVTA